MRPASRRTTDRPGRFLLPLLLLVLAAASAAAQVDPQYTFTTATGAPSDMSGATTLIGDGLDDVATSVLPIGFTFVFQGVPYTDFSVNTNGILRLGATGITNRWTNLLGAADGNYPAIANYWDDLHTGVTGSGGVLSALTGAPGERLLTVEWRTRRFGTVTAPGEIPYRFQTRLYEGSNVIELYYDSMSTAYSTSGTIGLAVDSTHFMSVTPGMGSPLSGATVSTVVANDTVQLQGAYSRIPAGTVYRFSPIIMGQFTSNGGPVGPGSALFTLAQSCVGDAALSMPVTIMNTGLFDMTIGSFDLFAVDSTDTQGQMRLVRDRFGRPVASSDYVITDAPGVAPLQSNVPTAFPDTLAPNESRTYWVTFVGQEPGRRLARAFLRTNATTFSGTDTTDAAPTLTMGLIPIELVASAVGSSLARDLAGSNLRTVVFPDTRAGDTITRSYTVVNAGACDLRINRGRLRIFSGDVKEFQLVSVFPGVRVEGGDYVIAPHDSGRITVAFMPVRSGTRMATVFMQTNDSSIGIPGVTERGSWYLDLHGRGRAGLDARDLALSPVVIGSFTNGAVEIENTSIASVDIAQIYFEGADAAEFTEDASARWPSPLPSRVIPGQKLRLGVRLTPAAGSLEGVHRATMVVVTTTVDTLRIRIRGEVGSQLLVVSPTSLFENVTIQVGTSTRATVRISNVGTLPIRLTRVEITGPDSLNYRLGILPRMQLDPGQTEFLEVTYAPVLLGPSSAQIEIASNAGPVQIVTLGGAAMRIRRDDVRKPGIW